MTDIRSVEAGKYNNALAEALLKVKEIEAPEWIFLVKTGANKMRPTFEPNFWQKRAASILKQIYVKKIVGVQRLRTRYGGRKKRGMPPAEFRKGGGKIIRKILQQAEKAGFVEKANGKKLGRQLSLKGREFMEKVAEGLK